MPLSLRSSSFCFLACLCSSVWVSAQTINQAKLTPPLYNIGEAFHLTSNCFIEDVYGAKFPSSFLGSSTNFTIFGRNRSLTFAQCHAPLIDNASLISATEALTLTNLSKLVLNENVSTGKNGLISGKKILVTSSRSVVVTNNRTPYTPVVTEITGPNPSTTVNCFCGSAIHTETSLDITKIRDNITFHSNSGNFGAALLNKTDATCNIENNSAAISFSQNFAACGGGAIYDGEITFKNNSGPITLSGNTAANGLLTKTPTNPATIIAAGCGGAICAPTKSVTFANNTGECNINYNLAENDGGAIYATTCDLTTSSPTYLNKNAAKRNGGAICAKALTITSKGPMVFFNNRAQKGGAIYVASTVGETNNPPASTLSLTASAGDMVFIGNMLDNRPGTRNAIEVEGDGKITSLNATGLSNIIFHDPITNKGPTITNPTTLDTIKINSPGLSGTVKFTSETLTVSEKLNPDNSTTSLFGKVIIEDGQLVVTNDATVNVLGLTATEGRLTLGSGASVSLLTTTAGQPTTDNFTIGKLGFDAKSYLNPNYSTASVITPTGKTITLSGSLDIVSEDEEDLYDNPLLLASLSIPLVTFTSNGNAAPTTTNFTAGNIEIPQHYGYQGVWSSTWTIPLLAPTPNGGIPSGTNNRTLYVIWRPDPAYRAPYVLDPERRGELVSNTLWTSFLATQAFSEALKETFLSEQEGVLISAKAIGSYVRHPSQKTHDGFKGRYGGYQASIGIHYPDDASVGLAFGQLYGQVKSKPYDAQSTEQISLVALFGKFLVATENNATSISWEASYGYTVNHMKTNYLNSITQRTRKSKGRWHNNTYHASISVEHPFLTWCTLTRRVAHDLELSGFISAEFMGGWQNAFSEKGALPRSFSRGRGHNITLPIGFTSEWYTPFKKAPSTLTLKLAYKPDVYRVNPHNVITILANRESIPIKGAQIPRNGFYLQMHDSVELSQHATGFLDYVFDSKRSYASHRITTGLQGKF
ncbi:Polymorphic membrane protein F,chlamydial polymorphic outer membrane protein repeat,Autotransporter beta-domain [Chlamydia poikilotherma]|uniref:Polymorphic membrane protein F,chlamydial polymorphic outer membrane protein repeat,Autotransporter beta-domain n=1 Tax=Chlamydia poikilotherma TaxID=1967783 RepID=A0A3B0QFL0_9CHLA|nr:polymorphic outer membrane protein middle domain-containing protein [Chlamydia poikilotherma]SYX08764.1 Polymorphic membrane protein F,chlamydial polymorphic outer membrane protein repeat,Autotransporter beta-domain [Chlamydia poikilotherma]